MADVQKEENNTVQPPDLGADLLHWEFPEFVPYRRGFWWYVIAISITIGLVIFGLITHNYLFLVLILLFGLIIYLRGRRKPAQLEIAIRERGIQLGSRSFYRWSDIKSFWIIYEPPEVKMLYLEFKGFRPSLSVFLQNQNPLEVRKILGKHLVEDVEKENESFSDGFGRMFKI